MADAPAAPKAKLTTKKDKIMVLKTIVWSATKKDANKTFLAGEPLVGFPVNQVAKFEEAGYLESPSKEED